MRRLSDNPDEVSWEEFYQTYRLTILAYAQRKGMDRTEAEDVLQEAMMSLMKSFRKGFVYDREQGSFRGFLRVIVRWRIADALRRKSRSPLFFKAEVEEFHCEGAGPKQDPDWQIALITQGMHNLHQSERYSEKNLAAFESYAIKGCSAKEAGEQHGLSANNVYQIYNRISEALRDEVAYLNGDDL